MGTNFYGTKVPSVEDLNQIAVKVLQGELEDAKDLLDSTINANKIHIGKSSGGWKFLFNKNEQDFTTIEEYKDYWKQFSITDEYGRDCDFEVLWTLIQEKQDQKSHFNTRPGVYIEIDSYDFSLSTEFC